MFSYFIFWWRIYKLFFILSTIFSVGITFLHSYLIRWCLGLSATSICIQDSYWLKYLVTSMDFCYVCTLNLIFIYYLFVSFLVRQAFYLSLFRYSDYVLFFVCPLAIFLFFYGFSINNYNILINSRR